MEYDKLLQEVEGLIEGETNYIANTANIASLIYHTLNAHNKQCNWAGFYFTDLEKNNGELVLGPFHGQPACIRIKPGKGVCGAAAKSLQTQLVPDVHKFPGHIACDSKSNSEIVIPLVSESPNGEKIVHGVLDLDCLVFNGFDDRDQRGLEEIARKIIAGCKWPSN